MIQLSGLTKSFGERVLLDDVTWQVSDRDRVGLCGPNGAGKTTLLRILGGLDQADAGHVVDFSEVEAVIAVARAAGVDGVLTVSADRAVPIVAV